MDSEKKSAGLAFIQAAQAAAPRSLGDRERVHVMDTAMGLAVRSRFPFKPEDAPDLRRMGIETTVGVFRALWPGYYRIACQVGGTYPRMWEAANSFRPCKAAVAVFPHSGHLSLRDELLEDNRIYKDIGVLMPQTFTAEEPNLATHRGLQVWWVTDITNETINLCRYTPSESYNGQLSRPAGPPARRRQVTREEFAKWQEETKVCWASDSPATTARSEEPATV